MSWNFSKDFCQLLDILNGRIQPKQFSPKLIGLAQRLGVLDAMVAKQHLRKSLGKRSELLLSQAAMGTLRLKETRQIAEAFHIKGIPLAPLKGMAYALMFESGGPKRSMSDIDVLVPASSFEEACRVMSELGYQKLYLDRISHSAEYEERVFTKNERLVEIHQYFLSTRRSAVNYDDIWSRAIKIEKEGVLCHRLSPEDTFLYHCLHMGIHEFTVGFRPIWELHRLIKFDKPDLSIASHRAREWKISRMVWCSLQLFDFCFPETLSQFELHMFDPYPLIQAILNHFIIEPSKVLVENPGALPRHVQLFRKSLLLDSPVNGLWYTWWYVKAYLGAI